MTGRPAAACRGTDDEVVVTGVGLVTAAGLGLGALADALLQGRPCGRPLTSQLPVAEAATVEVPLEEHPDFPDDRKALLAFAALDDALEAAGLPGEAPLRGRRAAVFLGTGLSSVTPHELRDDLYPHLVLDASGARIFDRASMARDLDPRHAAPRRHLPERVTQEVARRLGAVGPSGTSFSACAAAAQAMAEGARAIRRGQADIAVVGGHDSMIHPVGMLSFIVLGALSPDRCRPFDRRRDGFLIGEGAGLFVLERLGAARARGANVYARLLGAGTSVDAWNVTAPHPEGAGAELAMRRALRDAGLSADQVGYVNAHGTGTPVGDLAEAMAIARALGPVPVSSIKSAVGHTIAAAGAVEAAACMAGFALGFLPGTAGLDEPDPACPIDVLQAPVRREVGVMLSNSFGFGGQNACLALAHPLWEGPRV